MALNSQEENFISRLIEVIEKNINNTEYSVEQMARDVAMERTGLYRKLQAIAGITPSEFLRSVRLKRAAQILEDNKKLSITEISELVGFTSSRHFATCFKQMFGCTPSDYRKG
jgi:AraC-like DNA-binding protein